MAFFVRNQLSDLKKQTRIIIRNTRDERFEIEDAAKEKSKLFYNDAVSIGEAMCYATRAKIHRIADVILQRITRFDMSVNTSRLERLIPIHLSQIRRLAPVRFVQNKQFYEDMLQSLEMKVRWLKILLLRQHNPHGERQI